MVNKTEDPYSLPISSQGPQLNGLRIERGKLFWVKTVIRPQYHFLKLRGRQDLRDYQDLFFLHHFPDENDETQSTKGGINHVNPVDLVYVLFLYPSTIFSTYPGGIGFAFHRAGPSTICRSYPGEICPSTISRTYGVNFAPH